MTLHAPLDRRLAASIVLCFWVDPTHAQACTLCESAGGVELREAIFGPHFVATLLLSSLPFVLVLAIAAAIHFRPARKDRHGD